MGSLVLGGAGPPFESKRQAHDSDILGHFTVCESCYIHFLPTFLGR